MKDYYDILGVDRTADQNAIKKAYRKIALKSHPDRTRNQNLTDNQKDELEQEFKLASEAYNILSNPDSRREYDLNGGIDFENFDLNDFNPEVVFVNFMNDLFPPVENPFINIQNNQHQNQNQNQNPSFQQIPINMLEHGAQFLFNNFFREPYEQSYSNEYIYPNTQPNIQPNIQPNTQSNIQSNTQFKQNIDQIKSNSSYTIERTITISLKDLYHNVLKSETIERERLCNLCKGLGQVILNKTKCIMCEGRGKTKIINNLNKEKECPNCLGTGQVTSQPHQSECPDCEGRLIVNEKKEFRFYVGVQPDIRFPNEGNIIKESLTTTNRNYRMNNAPQYGDLIFHLNVVSSTSPETDCSYSFEELDSHWGTEKTNNLVIRKEISIYQLYYGVVFDFVHLDERILTIQTPKVQNNLIHVIKEEGLPIRRYVNNQITIIAKGDLHIKYVVQFPKLSEKRKSVLKRLFPPIYSNIKLKSNEKSLNEKSLNEKSKKRIKENKTVIVTEEFRSS